MSGTSDYGVTPRGRTRRTRVIGTVLGAILAIGVTGALVAYMGVRRQAAAEAQSRLQTAQFTVDGPACPALSAADFAARSLQAPKALQFNGVTFARRYGHVDCAMTEFRDPAGQDGVPVCQFTSPAVLVVTTSRGAFHFVPGRGQRATVSVRDGQPRCVLGGNFGLDPG